MLDNMLRTVSIILLLIITIGNADVEEDKRDVLMELLASDKYDHHIKPMASNNSETPTTVSVSLHVLSVSQIDDHRMLFSLELYFRQEWKDDRLGFNDEEFKFLDLDDEHRIWLPDIFFPNEYKSYYHDIMESNTFVKIMADGTISTSSRITLVLRCPMNFSKFPFDRQHCVMNIESYKWKADDLLLEWKNSTPVTMSGEILAPLFTIDSFDTHGGLIALETGTYSELTLDFVFARKLNYFLIQIYIPCCMIFVVSCLAFWLNTKLMTARALIGVTSLFSLAILVFNFNVQHPKVPYTRAIDVFTGVVMTFVFGALIETVIVHVSESKANANLENKDVIKDDVEQIDKQLEKRNTMLQMKKWFFDNHQSINDIDAACRVLYPLCFLIFLAIYCITYASIPERAIRPYAL